MKNKKESKRKQDGWKFFDDCLICQSMKEGKVSTKEELLAVFKKANKQNNNKKQ